MKIALFDRKLQVFKKLAKYFGIFNELLTIQIVTVALAMFDNETFSVIFKHRDIFQMTK